MENVFKERLKELRLENNLTQQQLAEKTNITQPAIAKWENGQRTPTMECLIILAKFFCVTIDYLVGLEN